jgi:hypothetical protein
VPNPPDVQFSLIHKYMGIQVKISLFTRHSRGARDRGLPPFLRFEQSSDHRIDVPALKGGNRLNAGAKKLFDSADGTP